MRTPHWYMRNRDGRYAQLAPHNAIIWSRNPKDASLLDVDGITDAFYRVANDPDEPSNDVITIERAL